MQVIPATPFSPGVGSLLKLPVNHLSSQAQPFCCCRPATLQVSILRAQNKNKSSCLKKKHSPSQEKRNAKEMSNSRERSPSAYLVQQKPFFLNMSFNKAAKSSIVDVLHFCCSKKYIHAHSPIATTNSGWWQTSRGTALLQKREEKLTKKGRCQNFVCL